MSLNKLWNTMNDASIHKTYIEAIRDLYTDMTNQVKTGTALSEKFNITKGLK